LIFHSRNNYKKLLQNFQIALLLVHYPNLAGDLYLRLHEVTHLVYPQNLVGKVSLDEALGTALGLARQINISGIRENWSQAVSRFFNNKCDPRETQNYRINQN